VAKKGSVLVVDDEEIMREVLETLLSSEGYRVDLAKTGEEGLEAYGRRAYDIVLLDVSMPGIGGLRALEEFLKMDSDAVIIMITAYATFDTAIAAWEHGAFLCIRKQKAQFWLSMTKRSCAKYWKRCSLPKVIVSTWPRPARRDWKPSVVVLTTLCCSTFRCQASADCGRWKNF
jgi:Response regulator containing CheY-like receiver, AAA-type ATPase, and DNA-binding domains